MSGRLTGNARRILSDRTDQIDTGSHNFILLKHVSNKKTYADADSASWPEPEPASAIRYPVFQSQSPAPLATDVGKPHMNVAIRLK